MTGDIKQFISIYKQLESVVRARGYKTVLDYENTLQQDDADRLRICRQMRNYLQHHSDGESFLASNSVMCSFLANLVDRCEKTDSRIQDVPPIHLHDIFSDIEKLFMKTKRAWLPVVNQKEQCVGTLAMSKFIFLSSKQSPRATLGSVATREDLRNEDIKVLLEESAEHYYDTDAVVVERDGFYIGVLRA